MSPLDRKVIVGGTHQQFMEWCRRNKVSPTRARRAAYPENLLGLELKEEDIVRLGPISGEMEIMLKTRIR